MATVLYYCPNTGFRVQGFTVDETIGAGGDVYVRVKCPACKLRHLVNAKTGLIYWRESGYAAVPKPPMKKKAAPEEAARSDARLT
jgi:hypothetical protein